MILSAKQQAMFWRVFAEAWAEHARAHRLDQADAAARDAYRRDMIRRATGRASLTEVGRTHEFDELMSLAAREAGLYEAAAHAALSSGRRALAKARDCARQCGEIAGVAGGEAGALAYVEATVLRAWKRESWEDVADPQLERVFMMIDTHRRRLLRAAGWRGGRDDPERLLGYRFGARYRRMADGRGVEMVAE